MLFMLLAALIFIFLVGLVIISIVAIVKKALRRNEDPTFRLLRQRFAEGEITEEEFQRKSTLLRK